MDLDAVSATVSHVWERGWAVIEDALDEATTTRLRDAADRRWDSHLRLQPDATFLHEFGFFASDLAFFEVLRSENVLGAVCSLLGCDIYIYIYHCHLNVDTGTPAARFTYDWHRDGGQIDLDLGVTGPQMSVKVGFALSDMTDPMSGQTLLVPCSHLVAQVPDVGKPQEGALAAPLPAGSALLLDRRTWHSRGPNETGRRRRMLFCAFTYRWVRSRDDVVIPDAAWRSLSPVDRQLVGWANGNRSVHAPTDRDVPLRRWWASQRHAEGSS